MRPEAERPGYYPSQQGRRQEAPCFQHVQLQGQKAVEDREALMNTVRRFTTLQSEPVLPGRRRSAAGQRSTGSRNGRVDLARESGLPSDGRVSSQAKGRSSNVCPVDRIG